MTIITSGTAYVDIDALACAYAYKELLKLKGEPSLIILPKEKTTTVPKLFQAIKYQSKLPKNFKNHNFVFVDISHPDHIDQRIPHRKIRKIFDHHFGYEEYWAKMLGENSIIKKVGACATLIWEEYKKFDFQEKLSELSANLLYTAIISNSLNLKSSVTSTLDRQAVKELKEYITLKDSWVESYFQEISREIILNPEESLRSEAKIKKMNGQEVVMMQLELWEAPKFIKEKLAIIESFLNKNPVEISFLSLPSIKEDKTYFICKNESSRKMLDDILDIKWGRQIGVLNSLIQRKAITKLLMRK